MMKKLFISQPMAGLSEDKIKQERERAIRDAETLFGESLEVIDSYINEDPPEGVNVPLWYLAKSIEFLSQADYAYFVAGWDSARGCCIEYSCAKQYDVDVYAESDKIYDDEF